MIYGDLSEFRIYEGELNERELRTLKALVLDGLEEDTDASFLLASITRSLAAFVPR